MMLAKFLFKVSILKTIFFNIRYFGLKTAILCPVCIGHGVKFLSLKGKIIFTNQPRPGMVFIRRTILDLHGKWVIHGNVRLNGGTDSLIFIGSEGTLETGYNFFANGPVALNCVKSIKFGDECLLAHKIEVLDTDFHKIFDSNGRQSNNNRSVVFGNKVWIGSNALILKGTKVGSQCIIGAGSVVSGDLTDCNSVYAGNPARKVKNNVTWDY